LTAGGFALGCPVEPLGDASPGLIPHGPPQLSYLAIARARCTLQLTSVKLEVGDGPRKRDDVGWRIPGSNFKSLIKGSSAVQILQFLQLQLEADVCVCTWNVAQADVYRSSIRYPLSHTQHLDYGRRDDPFQNVMLILNVVCYGLEASPPAPLR